MSVGVVVVLVICALSSLFKTYKIKRYIIYIYFHVNHAKPSKNAHFDKSAIKRLANGFAATVFFGWYFIGSIFTHTHMIRFISQIIDQNDAKRIDYSHTYHRRSIQRRLDMNSPNSDGVFIVLNCFAFLVRTKFCPMKNVTAFGTKF